MGTGILIFFSSEILQPVKQRMNDHHIGMKTIDSRRQNQIVGSAAEGRVPLSQEPVQEHPSQELRQMRTGNRWNLMPEDGARWRGTRRFRRFVSVYGEVFDALCIQMNLAAVIAGEPLHQFRYGALRAMAPIDEWRDNREPQVSVSSGAPVQLQER